MDIQNKHAVCGVVGAGGLTQGMASLAQIVYVDFIDASNHWLFYDGLTKVYSDYKQKRLLRATLSIAWGTLLGVPGATWRVIIKLALVSSENTF
jgi:hypothetical protein